MSTNIKTDEWPQMIEQLQQLQMTQAYQEDTIENLEKTIALQHQDIQQLKQQLTLLSEFLKNMKQQDGIKPPHEEMPPPHY
jgi:SlyX protein